MLREKVVCSLEGFWSKNARMHGNGEKLQGLSSDCTLGKNSLLWGDQTLEQASLRGAWHPRTSSVPEAFGQCPQEWALAFDSPWRAQTVGLDLWRSLPTELSYSRKTRFQLSQDSSSIISNKKLGQMIVAVLFIAKGEKKYPLGNCHFAQKYCLDSVFVYLTH